MHLIVLGSYLYFVQNGHHRDDNTEDEVEADEDLVLGAVVRFGVVQIEKHHGSKSQDIVQNGEEKKTYTQANNKLNVHPR